MHAWFAWMEMTRLLVENVISFALSVRRDFSGTRNVMLLLNALRNDTPSIDLFIELFVLWIRMCKWISMCLSDKFSTKNISLDEVRFFCIALVVRFEFFFLLIPSIKHYDNKTTTKIHCIGVFSQIQTHWNTILYFLPKLFSLVSCFFNHLVLSLWWYMYVLDSIATRLSLLR